MYVCMYACMYVCMYIGNCTYGSVCVCVYVCEYIIRTCVRLYDDMVCYGMVCCNMAWHGMVRYAHACMHRRMYVCMHACMYVCMAYVLTCVRVDVCLQAHIYV